jgi:hypothetical protein
MEILKMKRSFTYIIFLFIALAGTQCKKENICDCIKRTGDVITERREIPSFTSLYATDNINVVLIPDSEEYVDVEAGEHLIALIKTEVSGNELQIRNNNRCNFTRSYDIPISVYVHLRSQNLRRLTYEGVKSISCTDTLRSDSLYLEILSSGNVNLLATSHRIDFHQQGAGDFSLQGRCDDLILYVLGAGYVTTDNIDNNYTWVYTRGTGKITCAPTDSFVGYVEGYGSVYYRNSPSLELHVLGPGGVFPL